MTPNQMEWSRARDRLAAVVSSLGYPEEFADLLAKELGSPGAIDRMAARVRYEKPGNIELIVDEMLAIRAEIDAWREKKEGREAQTAYSWWLNSETRRRNSGEDDEL